MVEEDLNHKRTPFKLLIKKAEIDPIALEQIHRAISENAEITKAELLELTQLNSKQFKEHITHGLNHEEYGDVISQWHNHAYRSRSSKRPKDPRKRTKREF